MAVPELAEQVIERIRHASPLVTDTALARELGVHRNTVRKYRREGRQDRREVARETIARHVEENIPDALSDLTDLRKMAREQYEATGDPKQGTLWHAAIKTTLDHVKPDDSALDEAIERELALLSEQPQGALAGTGQAAEQYPALN